MLILKSFHSIKCLEFLVSHSELALKTLLPRREQAKVCEHPCSAVPHTMLQKQWGKEEDSTHPQRGRPKAFPAEKKPQLLFRVPQYKRNEEQQYRELGAGMHRAQWLVCCHHTTSATARWHFSNRRSSFSAPLPTDFLTPLEKRKKTKFTSCLIGLKSVTEAFTCTLSIIITRSTYTNCIPHSAALPAAHRTWGSPRGMPLPQQGVETSTCFLWRRTNEGGCPSLLQWVGLNHWERLHVQQPETSGQSNSLQSWFLWSPNSN